MKYLPCFYLETKKQFKYLPTPKLKRMLMICSPQLRKLTYTPTYKKLKKKKKLNLFLALLSFSAKRSGAEQKINNCIKPQHSFNEWRLDVTQTGGLSLSHSHRSLSLIKGQDQVVSRVPFSCHTILVSSLLQLFTVCLSLHYYEPRFTSCYFWIPIAFLSSREWMTFI